MTYSLGMRSPLSGPPDTTAHQLEWGQYLFWEEGAYYRAIGNQPYSAYQVFDQGGPNKGLVIPAGSYARCVNKSERPITNPPDSELTQVFVNLDWLTPNGEVIRVGFYPGVRGDAWVFERIDNELLVLALAAKGLA